jgi:hypothetical protein
VLIATTATLSLLLIGLLVVTMTPERADSPQTASSTLSVERTPPAGLQQADLPVVTPIGDDGVAVTTLSAIGDRTGMLQARLPDGAIYDVELVATTDGLAVVALPEAARADGYQLASSPPAPSDTVLVEARTPLVVSMTELAGLDVEEGTPVLDERGDLLGLCSQAGGDMELMTVATMPRDPTEPATTAPPTTARPTTTAPATTAPATTVPTTVATTMPPATSPPTTGPTTSGPVSTVSGGAPATSAPG